MRMSEEISHLSTSKGTGTNIGIYNTVNVNII